MHHELLLIFLLLKSYAFVVFWCLTMEGIYLVHLMVMVLTLGLLAGALCQVDDGSDNETTAVYIVTLKQAPASHYYGELRKNTNVFKHGVPRNPKQSHNPRY